MHKKIYPDSGVELSPFISKNYDRVMNLGSVGLYNRFIKKAIAEMQIKPNDTILDLGCGTGRNAQLMLNYLNEDGHIVGLDISENMAVQFKQKFAGTSNVRFINQRIDTAFDLHAQFDKVFISFVIHGFPHEIRQQVIKNALTHLKPGGVFSILDFGEFDMNKMPYFHKKVFTAVECKYAFDYIEKDWKSILASFGFNGFEEFWHLKKYVRLLKATKA
jgi:demethylmenaquinone methyltransferase/2-methoxy-6-polyprenyl-1,4-benzoquinol methylase